MRKIGVLVGILTLLQLQGSAKQQTVPMTIDTSDCESRGYVPGVFYSCQLRVVGDSTPPYNWKITVGMLPPGLTLDPQTGVISGVVLAPPTDLQQFTAHR
jgi:hypothetical protein